jgi:hypothetical protein
MKYAMVINIYFTTKENEKHPFDHPTPLDKYEELNTFEETLKSINEMNEVKDEVLTLYIFAAASGEITEKDKIIRKKVEQSLSKSKYNWKLYTNSDIEEYKNKYNSNFFSMKGYPEIRNQGFIIPLMNKEDVIIQIDDDELLRPEYFETFVDLIKCNSDKFLITAPYEKNGTVRILGEDPVKSWKKFSAMDLDIVKLSKDNTLKETTFGFGGNMVIRREFAEKMFYPLDVPRGEDFSLLLASRLIYENGNEYAGIKEKDGRYKTYYIPDKKVTIIHKPPVEAKKDILYYIEKNFKRFIMEWNMFKNQDKLKINDLKELSNYLYYMIGYEDIKEYTKIVMNEVKEKYPNSETLEKELLDFADLWTKENNRFEDYKKLQKEYIDLINKIVG